MANHSGSDGELVVPQVAPHPRCRAAWKRILDLVVSIAVLLLGFPVFLIIALVVRLTSPGPVIYKARRVGLGGKMFNMYKFRSMYMDADQRLKEVWAMNQHEGPVFKAKHDPRITPIGRFIRKYSLDELPQFINVLVGECSLVGPRALHDYEVAKFDDYALNRLKVKPGITCYWQIGGRSDLDFEQWMDLDNKYIEDFGLWTDIKILAKTPSAVLFGRGAY
jgi:lipopolysaccharide/colanic/teichoic acid biosynthesis glycosyltransferase